MQQTYDVALWLDAQGIDAEKSQKTGLTGGRVEPGLVSGVAIESKTPCYGGIRITGGEYEIRDLSMKLDGSGGDDFGGKGTGLVCAGDSRVHVKNYTCNNRGVIRNAVVVTDDAEAVFECADITCYGGTPEELAKAKKEVRGLPHVPWVLGLTGNNRATNLLSRGKVTYIDSSIRAEGWGALSTDGPTAPKSLSEYSILLRTVNCDVEVFGPSGYGSYAIGAGKNIFEDTRIKVPDYGLIVANEIASAEFTNGTVVESGRFGVMWHQNQGGLLKIEDSTFHTKRSTFLPKACYPVIQVSRSNLESQSGIILELIDMDDPGIGKDSVQVDTQEPVKDPSHQVSQPNYADVVMFNNLTQKHCCTDLQASFSDMELTGDFYNAITNAASVGSIYEGGMPDMSAPPPEEMEIPQDGSDFVPPMPEMKPSTLRPINLVLSFRNVRYTGALSATRAKHRVGIITAENNQELGMVTHRLCPAVNNGVIASFDGKSSWMVTKTCYLTALELADGATVAAPRGKKLTMTVDGKITPILPGTYQGNIVMTVD